jgi:hypothetical protein
MSHQTVSLGDKKYSIDKLRELVKDFPVTTVPVEKIVYNIHDRIWRDKEGQFSAACVLIQRFEPRFAAHYERIAFADMNFPILITSNYKILDGYHRFNKAKLQSQPYINAIIVSRDILNQARVR